MTNRKPKQWPNLMSGKEQKSEREMKKGSNRRKLMEEAQQAKFSQNLKVSKRSMCKEYEKQKGVQ